MKADFPKPRYPNRHFISTRGFFTIFFYHSREINHLFCVACNYVEKIVAKSREIVKKFIDYRA